MAGYTKLASFMTEKHHPILRKYQHLAVRDLLLLQAELCHLDCKYNAIVRGNVVAEDERKLYDRDWLLMHTAPTRGYSAEQWEVALTTREKLREYCTFSSECFPWGRLTIISLDAAITKYTQVASIRQPKDSERSILHEWISSVPLSGGCGFVGRDLGDRDQLSVYDAAFQEDLAILSDSHGEGDLFTKFIAGPLLGSYHRLRQYYGVSILLSASLQMRDLTNKSFRPLSQSIQKTLQ